MPRIALLLALLLASVAVYAQPMSLTLDATDVARGVLHSRETIPAAAGAMTLLYPKWIPGEHGPTGPIAGLVNVQISANGKRIEWRRDPVEMFAFHFDVPQGASSIEVTLDSLLPAGGQFSGGRTATAVLAVISWNTAVLFPRGHSADDIMVAPSLRIPAGFKYATALPLDHAAGDTLTFKEAALSTLIDSPVQLGVHQTIVHLHDADGRPHEIDMVADSDSALELPKDFNATYDRLVEQAGLLFGGRHYRDYHWLLTLSDNVAHFGLEHHESSDDRVGENSLESASGRRNIAGLLAHEYVHSWNGKYRRPGRPPQPRLHETDGGRAALGVRGTHRILELHPAAAFRRMDSGAGARAHRHDGFRPRE
jgi:predicted metalloprotease with PDZ domain